MAEEIGVVRSVAGGLATVEFERSSACGKCGACGLLSGASNRMVTTAAAPPGVQVGDQVRMVMSDSFFYLSTVLLYGVPLAALVLGVALGSLLFGPDRPIFPALIGLGLAAACYAILRLCDPWFKKLRQGKMRLEVVVPKE